MLNPAVHVFETDNIVFVKDVALLYFEHFYRLVIRVLKRMYFFHGEVNAVAAVEFNKLFTEIPTNPSLPQRSNASV